MSDSVEMTGWVSAKKEVRTMKDLRDLVAWADTYKVRDEAVVERNFTHLFIDFLGVPEDAKATWIECGDHFAGDEHWDVLIETHQHPKEEKYNGPETYEEALEMALDAQDDDEDGPITCVDCGISHDHEDFGAAATAKFNSKTGEYDYYCEPCIGETELDAESKKKPAPFDWPALDRLNRYGDESRPE